MRIGFVVLVYGKPMMAKESVCYLKRIVGINEASIVVVDNCSPDNTYDMLVEWFGDDKNIHILRNKSNQGFAKGNNSGYSYAKEKLGCDFLIVMNSDVYIKDTKFIQRIKDNPQIIDNYEVIGPDIVNNDGHHSNPLALAPLPSSLVRKTVILNNVSVLFYKFGLHRLICRKKSRLNNAEDIQEVQENIMPHGACVIYTPKWVSNQDKAFYPGTFLFCEELFLYDYLLAKGHKSIYWPELVVNHIGDGSIDGDKPKKKIFINSCHSKSLKTLLNYRKDIIGNWEKE